MTELEQVAYSDGFRILLLGTDVQPRANLWRYEWRLFDGGRLADSGESTGTYASPPPTFASALRSALVRVVAPPHVLVCHGRGWRHLLEQVLAIAILNEMRILDLTAVAKLLAPAPAGTGDGLLAAYGIAGRSRDASVLDDCVEDLLWQVLHRAGNRGLNWSALIKLPESERPTVSFEGYAFDAESIARLPAVPGVYVMRRADGGVLYVGKSGDLSRRVGEYFQPQRELPPKIAAIREHIRSFETHQVGSALEALLLENRLIRDLCPQLNVQRQVAETHGIYGVPGGTIVMVLSSRKRARCEVYFMGETRGVAVQVGIAMGTPPIATLVQVLDWFSGKSASLKRTRAVTDWGSVGNAIGARFFGAHRVRLHWCELPPGEGADGVQQLLRVVAHARDTGFDPAEVRF